MIALLDTAPDVAVDAAEYQRLLGYPREHALEGRALELMAWARDWYARHGHPWVVARPATRVAVGEYAVEIDDESFTSPRLVRAMREASADAAVLVAASAGPELEAEAQRLWREEKPDEYFFLEVYGSAVVEHLVTMAGARLCAAADGAGRAVLPHQSPGYAAWDVADQGRLLEVVRRTGALPGPLEALDSGMLRPKKSLLALFG
ncbi:MAG TPA: hypothetical protein VEA99_03405, partial [Gemmatimonadaceae bacterium]|nr:hypothetical protein [Gemmatimonadaceae bacterium]